MILLKLQQLLFLMSLFHQEWRQEAYFPRANQHLRDLPQNHVKRAKQVPFQFHDYKANNKLPCLPYERTYIQCLNNYGVQEAGRVPECVQMAAYFNECVKVNAYFGFIKRVNPEHFGQSQYSRAKPNLSDIGF